MLASLGGCIGTSDSTGTSPDPSPGESDLAGTSTTAFATGTAGEVVVFRANDGKFVSSEGGTTGTSPGVYADRAAIGPWEKFRLISTLGGFALGCQGASGVHYYVSAEGGGGGDLHCNRTAIGPWETFQLQCKSSYQVALRTANGHYVSAQNGGGAGVDATRTAAGSWETFGMEEGVASGSCSNAEYRAQNLNGASFWTCQGSTRYICDGVDNKIVEACGAGCNSGGVGHDDTCASAAAPQCSSAEYSAQNANGVSYWTCQGSSRYVCDGNHTKVTELCASGCSSRGADVDDQCNSGSGSVITGNDYPPAWRNSGKDAFATVFGLNRECVSFAAWKVYLDAGGRQVPTGTAPPSDWQKYSINVDQDWGNASNWSAYAAASGVRQDNSPTAGSIAQWVVHSSIGMLVGHVGVVKQVYGDGSIDIEQYNLREDGLYSILHMARNSSATDTSNGHGPWVVPWPDHFIHIHGL